MDLILWYYGIYCGCEILQELVTIGIRMG
jgi:hypothetical protein